MTTSSAAVRGALAGVGGLMCASADHALGPPVVVVGVALLAGACRRERLTSAVCAGAVFGFCEAVLAFSAIRYGAGAVALALALNSVKRALLVGLIWSAAQLSTSTWAKATTAVVAAGVLVAVTDVAGPWALGTLYIPVSFAESVPHSNVIAAIAAASSTEVASAALAAMGVAAAGLWVSSPRRAAALVALVAAASMPGPSTTPSSTRARWHLVQTHIPNEDYARAQLVPGLELHNEQVVLDAIAQHAQPGHVVVLGETVWRPAAGRHAEVLRRLQADVDDKGHELLLGLAVFVDGAWANRAYALRPHQPQQWTQKSLLVPLVERAFAPGGEVGVVELGGERVGVLNCVESLYPHAARQLARDGVDRVVVVANDAGFDGGHIAVAHARRAAVVAWETGVPVAHLGQDHAVAFAGP